MKEKDKKNYVYVGVDLHKATHTAVIMDCWNKKLGEITIDNTPADFPMLTKKVAKLAHGLTPVYGLENAYGYGRGLAVWLLERNQLVKDVNPSLSYNKRMSEPMTKKNDSFDALCVANVLLEKLDELPDANPEDSYWTLKQLVNRRDGIVKDGTRLKNKLHEQLVHAYPSYKKFFSVIDLRTALYFWQAYPSPVHLSGISAETLAEELRPLSHNQCSVKRAQLIINHVLTDGNTTRDHQEQRDFITRRLVHDLEHQIAELKAIEVEVERMIPLFGYQLTTIPGVNTVTAAKLISEIGNIDRFPNADKLARYSGIAPINFSSGGKGNDKASRQGNRTLNGVFYFMAIQMVQTARGSKKPRQPAFHAYFIKKKGGDKKGQKALKCIQRRLVNIVYGMMRNKTAYRMPELLETEQ